MITTKMKIIITLMFLIANLRLPLCNERYLKPYLQQELLEAKLYINNFQEQYQIQQNQELWHLLEFVDEYITSKH